MLQGQVRVVSGPLAERRVVTGLFKNGIWEEVSGEELVRLGSFGAEVFHAREDSEEVQMLRKTLLLKECRGGPLTEKSKRLAQVFTDVFSYAFLLSFIGR